jgi:hypothetical protein
MWATDPKQGARAQKGAMVVLPLLHFLSEVTYRLMLVINLLPV